MKHNFAIPNFFSEVKCIKIMVFYVSFLFFVELSSSVGVGGFEVYLKSGKYLNIKTSITSF